ncbi:hypothetical protein CTEN210_05804 [Chaetoceros tenuissimus]|uniref:Uncharacterized protein n=1 Tax=Chaetoceros tenuissimus TaxID=426638 RepID=A0AAD3CNP9_9STRA|nr:hypothetical protein CTEN210_05804 [Chaetoceros tenuissimus]
MLILASIALLVLLEVSTRRKIIHTQKNRSRSSSSVVLQRKSTPDLAKDTACIDEEESSVIRAFELNGFYVQKLTLSEDRGERLGENSNKSLDDCLQTGKASIAWSKYPPSVQGHPWQRLNSIPNQDMFDDYAVITQALSEYSNENNIPIEFLPGIHQANTGLTFQGNEISLRAYFLIASVDPLIVLYHPGYLNTSRSDGTKGVTGLDEWEIDLNQYVNRNSNVFTTSIRSNPLDHIHQQVMDAQSIIVSSLRSKAFVHPASMENGFTIIATDFKIDAKLNVWLSNIESNLHFSDNDVTKSENDDQILSSTIILLTSIRKKESQGEPIIPLKQIGRFRPVYTDSFQFRYKFPRIVRTQSTERKRQR